MTTPLQLHSVSEMTAIVNKYNNMRVYIPFSDEAGEYEDFPLVGYATVVTEILEAGCIVGKRDEREFTTVTAIEPMFLDEREQVSSVSAFKARHPSTVDYLVRGR